MINENISKLEVNMILPVIMAGGTGSRLWPMSRERFPKQFLKLYGEQSMLQETVTRLYGLEISEPMVICNEQHRFIVAEQLRQLDKLSNNIILEPVGRNTAPAIALAAFSAIKNNESEDPLLLVLAADHVIDDTHAFHKAIMEAVSFANEGKLVTFGIVPTGPETGYGYIQRGNNIGNHNVFEVERFVEKPNIDIATKYLESGEYYWNSGMFLFRAKRYLDELKIHREDIFSACKQAMETRASDPQQDFIRVGEKAFYACPDESVDYAVMEKTSSAVVVPLDAGWNDVGSWSALWDVTNKDAHGNVLNGDVFINEVNDCYINSEEQLVSVIGVKNLIIISTKDAVLVTDKSKVQDVKK